jgi:hypothetical protein
MPVPLKPSQVLAHQQQHSPILAHQADQEGDDQESTWTEEAHRQQHARDETCTPHPAQIEKSWAQAE